MEPLFINTSGGIERVTPDRLIEAHALGWVPASPEQTRDFLLREKYGTTSQAALAGLESAGSAATFGLSSLAERGLGVDPEAMRAREMANPVASGVGTAVGILAPAIATAGSSLAGEGAGAAIRGAAELAAPSLISKVGAVAGKAATAALPAGETLLAKLSSKAAAKAIAGGVEGLGWGAGQLVHEAALADDPNEVAESALATLGTSALLMGGVTGGMGALGGLTEHLLGKAATADLSPKIADWLKDVEVRSNLKAAGAIQSNLSRAGKQVGEDNLEAIALEMRDMGLLRGPFDTPKAVLERAQDLQNRSGATLGEVLKSADEVASAEGGRLAEAQGMLARARRDILKPLMDNPLTVGAGRGVDEALLAWGDRFANGATLEELQQMRRQLSEHVYGLRGQMDPLANASKAAYRDMRKLVSREIEAGVERSGIPTDVWKTANREYEVASRAADFAQSALDRNAGNHLVSLTEGMSGLAGAVSGGAGVGLAAGLGWGAARRQGSATLGWMAKGLRELLEGESGAAVTNKTAKMIAAERAAAANVIPGPFGGRPALPQPVSAGASSAPETAAALAILHAANARTDKALGEVVAHVLDGAKKALPAAGLLPLKEHAERVEAVQRAAADMAGLQRRLVAQSDDIAEHAPTVAGAMSATSARIVAYLASKTPKSSPSTPLQAGSEVSASERARFDRYYTAATDPLGVLRRIADGTGSPEDTQTIQTLYPALMNKLRAKAIEHVSKLKSPPSYRARLTLSALTGMPLDKSLQPRNILMAQSIYNQPSMKDGMDMPATKSPGGADKLTLGKRNMTSLQASATRES